MASASCSREPGSAHCFRSECFFIRLWIPETVLKDPPRPRNTQPGLVDVSPRKCRERFSHLMWFLEISSSEPDAGSSSGGEGRRRLLSI